MGRRDPRVDAYIAKSPEFARPVLSHIRDVVHSACPETEETLKWSVPHFMYRGMLCSMAAFKHHCGLVFWKGSLIMDGKKSDDGSAGQFGRITGMSDLPSDKVLAGYIRKAMKLNDSGVKPPRQLKQKEPLVIPDILSKALKKNSKARSAFEGFSPSHQREYIEWIAEAKSDDTRQRRLDQAIEWMAEGKSRNWKYEGS